MSAFDPAGFYATGSAGDPANSGIDEQGTDSGMGYSLICQRSDS
jgi:hypothetical protein